jgi:hypothetical protein
MKLSDEQIKALVAWADELDQQGTSRGPIFDAAMEVAQQVRAIVKSKHGPCGDCPAPATWMRHTQFSGDHPFCEEHAVQQEDFGKSDPSYFFWDKL